MGCSAARLAANRANAARSTGPRTVAGKAISRRNGLRHGLTGAGIVLPPEDLEVIEQRFTDLTSDFKLQGSVDQRLTRRAALLSVRLDRVAMYEAAYLTSRIIAIEVQDEAAWEVEINRLMGEMIVRPAVTRRAMLTRPDGVERLIGALWVIAAKLIAGRWSPTHARLLDLLLGRDPNWPAWRSGNLSAAVLGDFTSFEPGEAAGLDIAETRAWACNELLDLIDGEIRQLEGLAESMVGDPTGADADRAATTARHLTLRDASQQSSLLQRYEASIDRQLNRIIDNLRSGKREAASRTETGVCGDRREFAAGRGGFGFVAGSSRPAAGSQHQLRPGMSCLHG